MARGGLILLPLCCALAAPAGAQVAARRRELQKIQRELEAALAEVESLRAQERGLGLEVNALQSGDTKARRRQEELQESIRRAEARRESLKGRLEAAGRVTGFWRAALAGESARHAAAASGPSGGDSTGALWAEEYRRRAIIGKARHLRGLAGFQEDTRREQTAVRRKALELDEARRRVSEERERRRREYEAKKSELDRTQDRILAASRRARELEESAKALTALIERLGKAARPRPGRPAVLDIPRHSLPWPAEGRVVRGFGRERDPELGTWIVRQGVLLSTPPAAPVAALRDGRVIFSGPFRSYGRVLILDHGGGFFAVYGELSEALKAKGQEVRAGETVARAGEGPDGRGRLYMEMRRGSEALDPADWLSRRP